nr:InlB B-repeat-containing protein [Candidatus Enterousia merdequi]
MKNILKYCAIGCALFTINDAVAGRADDCVERIIISTGGRVCSVTPIQNDDECRSWTCGGTISLCPAGYYCRNYVQTACPEGKTSQAGAISEADCYYTDSVLMTMESDDTVNEEILKTSDDAVEVQTAAIFEPNTININWKDAEGNTFETTTCEYDGSIITPTTAPTKKGYTFTGWRNHIEDIDM